MPRLLPMLLLLLLLFGGAASAAAADHATAADRQPPAGHLDEADHQALRALLKAATEALNRLDAQGLRRLLADGFVVTLADQTLITDSDQLQAYFDRYFGADESPIKAAEFAPRASRPTLAIDRNTGLAHGLSTDRYRLADDTPLTLQSRWTATVVRRHGDWLIQSFHAGVDMTDNAVLDAVRERAYGWTAGGLAGGLLVGAVLVLLVGRARRRG